ncbi:MAG: hypothetical protein HZA06_02505, partial [Nitrospirae bacterium]|nr:hypothetical protein [Nitrospirota bacterium]
MFVMETKKKMDNLILKKWINVNGNGNGKDHDSESFIIYKSFQVGDKSHFSVGDSWTVSTDGVFNSFKV